jgi:hypothetical protein
MVSDEHLKFIISHKEGRHQLARTPTVNISR